MMNRNRILKMGAAMLAIFSPAGAWAQEASFEEVWAAVSKSSKAISGSRLELEAAQRAKARADLHWLPRLYITARGYQTNDPGDSFFVKLEQRSVTASDFDPGFLNRPESRFYARGAVGLDLPLYEGGMRFASIDMHKHLAAAKVSEAEATRISQYAEVAKAYGAMQSLIRQRARLADLKQALDRVVKGYKVGIRSNPVGYSGLLGLKTLSNWIDGFLLENEAKIAANRLALEEMGFSRAGWMPQPWALETFVNKYFNSGSTPESSASRARKSGALAAVSGAAMEKARYLPRIGLFAEEYLFHGNRSTEDGYSAGFYLQWNLFNPSDFGQAGEASLRAAAAESFSLAAAERERAEAKGLEQALLALRENMKLTELSQKLLQEQTQVAEGLFRTGSIQALQLTEALSRRLDLIAAHTDAELGLLKLEAERANKTNFRLPFSEGESR